MRTPFLVALGVSTFGLATGAHAGVTIVNPDVGTSLENAIWAGAAAGDRSVVVGSSITVGASIPLTKSFSNAGNGSSVNANATFSFTNDAFSISNIDNKRVGFGAIAGESIRVAFTVDTPTDFIFSGSYISTNSAASSGRAAFENVLTDRTTSANLIPSTSTFTSTFNAGVNAISIPTATGTLLPGHVYIWQTTIQSLSSGTGAPEFSTGTGNITLSFVPAPGSVGVLALGAGAMLRRRRK
jgi:hypothetical protein